MPFKPGSTPGLLHHYTERLVAFEHTSPSSTASAPAQNTILFIGGLSDGLLTVPYATILAQSLPPSFSLSQVLLSSAYTGWGTSSVSKDATELAQCVKYFKQLRPRGKVVLMGHSTGCQDTMEYLVGEGSKGRPPIDGAIIQAPVSDREAMESELDAEVYRRSIALAKEMVDEGKGEEIMPRDVTQDLHGAPCCARRWLSLASPDHDGEDDYFSSDLPLERLQRTFGKLPKRTPLCILYSGEDEFVPKTIQKQKVVENWIDIVNKGEGVVDETNSGLVQGASHSLKKDPEDVVERLVARVVNYLQRLENGDFEAAGTRL